MKKKDKFSRYQDQSVINMDSFDKRRYAAIAENSSTIKSLTKNSAMPGFDHLLGDIWGSLYKMNPTLKEEVSDHLKPNHSLIERLISDESFEQHRISTRLDELTSAIGTLKFGEETMKWIEKQQQENERMKELMQQMQGLNKQNKTGKNDEKIDELAQELQQELQQSLDQNGDSFHQAMQQAMENTTDLANDVKSMLGNGSGNEEADLRKVPLREQLKLAELLAGNNKLKEVAEWAGRMRSIARKKQKSKHSESIDRNGVTIGNEIERLLPAELMQYAHPITKLDFARRLTEGETLVYEQKGKETLGKGPIIVCLDQSGSMENLDSQAKGFALALMWIAKKQRRDFAFIPFSDNAKLEIYPKGKISITEMARMAVDFRDGGTNFIRPLQMSLDVISNDKSKFGKADVVFITDGEAQMSDDFLKRFNNSKKEKGFNVMTLIIGQERYRSKVEPFSDKIVITRDFHNETAFEAFTI